MGGGGKNVKEQASDMTLEDFGDPADGSQPHVVSGCPIQPNHHVLDHGDLTSRQRSTTNSFRIARSDSGPSGTPPQQWPHR
jgi:hypothetical protein